MTGIQALGYKNPALSLRSSRTAARSRSSNLQKLIWAHCSASCSPTISAETGL